MALASARLPDGPTIRAQSSGLLPCDVCGLVCRRSPGGAAERCPRCNSRLDRDRGEAVSRCWAFLLAAAILYVPANILPVMVTSSLFGTQRDTILSGIIYLWISGSQGLALLVFVASILVPLVKIGALALLSFSVRLRWAHSRRQRLLLYRLVELIGRWSMLDMFVVTLMVALVHFSALAVIEAGPGAAAFGAVVVLTMFAAQSFDPRLLWDGDKDEEAS